MATKTITITEDAYERLAAQKEDNESFSEVIGRITNKISLVSMAGILTEQEADKIEQRIKNMHQKSRKKLLEIRQELQE